MHSSSLLVTKVLEDAKLYQSERCDSALYTDVEQLIDWQDIGDLRDTSSPALAEYDVIELASAKTQIARLRQA